MLVRSGAPDDPHPFLDAAEDLHEPMTPAVCVATLALAKCPIVATHHAHGDLGWMRYGLHFWGFLMERIDARIAVSPMAAESAAR